MRTHRHWAISLVTAIGAFVAALLVCFDRTRMAIAAALSSSAVLLALLAHLGILAAVVAPVLTWRHRARRRNRLR